MSGDKYKFYFALCLELLFWPILWIKQQLVMSFGTTRLTYKSRKPVEENRVAVCVHEWGGYKMERLKTIKNKATFTCGLKFQIERFARDPNVDFFITISDAEKHTELNYLYSVASVIEVCNKGMDFSGYAAMYDHLSTQPNKYVVLTNSSVNSLREDFLSRYIEYLEQNPEVGMLGVSYCTKMIQTLVRRNFTPHLQSFFLLTTTEVLREVVRLNGGKFPGKGVNHKLLLIRKGEIRMSKLVEKAGYRLSVVSPVNGDPYKFECFSKWKLPYGDIRQKIDTPNRITPIKR